MFAKDQYQLIDFGNSKKIELFSGAKVVRSCPAAAGIALANPGRLNDSALLSHNKRTGEWNTTNLGAEPWTLRHGRIEFELKLTPFGHLGVFPEQACNWEWIDKLPIDLRDLNALNLFAYTGGTSMALADKGAVVTHVDSAKNVVRWASSNAKLSSLSGATIRWIVEDAMKFVEREIRRGNRYDIVVADPPAIGHAGQKMTWKINRDLEKLIRMLAELTGGVAKMVLLTCHSEGIGSNDLRDMVARSFELASCKNLDQGSMNLTCIDGRKLNCGQFLRWHC